MEKLRCNPLACFTTFFIINGLLFAWIKTDIVEMRGILYKILAGEYRKTVEIGPTTQKLAQIAPYPGLRQNN